MTGAILLRSIGPTKWRLAGAALVLLLVAIGVRYWPRAPLSAQIPSSTAVFAANGELLRLTLADDQQYRVWTRIEDISPQLVEALLLHEDRHFYRHFGVNPFAMLRAAAVTFTGGARQGGSTLTMQLARELYGLNTRTVAGKLRQMLFAAGLELRYSKRDLLEAHLNLMPYGGNMQGVGAASLVYFRKSAHQLVLSEALSLVLIPQSPLQRSPTAKEPAELLAARERLFARWLDAHPDALHEAGLISLPLRYARLDQLPFDAPHFAALMLAKTQHDPAAPHKLDTTLDASLQRLTEQVIAGFVREQSRLGVRNASALLVDYRDMSVRAMVGSADFFANDIAGQVNGTLAKRSPGSALKPFIYALALDQGLIHPQTMLKDAPTSFAGFSPENFDGRFIGPLSATEALTRSRNIPAVALSANLAEPSWYQFLKSAGISKLAAEHHYGLALALGGGEVTMEEIVTLYAMLANQGVLAPLRFLEHAPRSEGVRLISPEASFITLDMLASAQRPDGNRWSPTRLPVAWKTGTSWGFRDAWTVGVFGPYVLAVWVGNFDGSSNPEFVGVQTAAPLLFRIVDAMTGRDRSMQPPPAVLPDRLVRVDVCSATGELPNADCPQTVSTWYIPGVSPIKVSDVHRRLWIDVATGIQACPPYDLKRTRSEVYEFWPSDVQRLFSQAGMPRRAPPADVECSEATRSAPRITSPTANVTYTVRSQQADGSVLPLAANTDSGVQRLHWFVDNTYVGTSRAGEALAWRAERSGRHIVRAVDDRGRGDSRELDIAIVR